MTSSAWALAPLPSGSSHLVLVIDTLTQKDTSNGNQEHTEILQINRLRKQFVQQTVFLIRENTNDSIRDALIKVIQSDSQVDGLLIMAHGTSTYFADKNTIYSSIGNNVGFDIELADRDIQNVFGPLTGHFSPGARIVFDSCTVLPTEAPSAARLTKMKEIAFNFGLKNGSLYMNDTNGALITDIFYKTEFWDQPDFRMKASGLFMQATALVTFPVSLWSENSNLNQGNLLVLDEKIDSLYKYDFFKAEGTAGVPQNSALLLIKVPKEIKQTIEE
jgi:hypothetical protein